MTQDQIYEIIKLSLGALGSMITIVGVVVGAFVKHLHGKGMNELVEIKDAITESKIKDAVTDEKLSRLDEKQEMHGAQIHKLNNEVHYIRGKMVTPQHVELMIEASK